MRVEQYFPKIAGRGSAGPLRIRAAVVTTGHMSSWMVSHGRH